MAMLNADQPGRGVHVRLLDDPGNGVWVNSQGIDRTAVTKGSVRHYARGKRRSVTWGATDRNATVDMDFNTVGDMRKVASWVDRVVLVRSLRGEVVAGLVSNAKTSGMSSLNIGWLGGSLEVQETTEDGTLEGVRRD